MFTHASVLKLFLSFSPSLPPSLSMVISGIILPCVHIYMCVQAAAAAASYLSDTAGLTTSSSSSSSAAVDPSTSFLVRNFAGCPVSLRVTSPNSRMGTDVLIAAESAQYLEIPVNYAETDRDRDGLPTQHPHQQHPHQQLSYPWIAVHADFSNPRLQFHQSSPVPLHLLTLSSIAVYPTL